MLKAQHYAITAWHNDHILGFYEFRVESSWSYDKTTKQETKRKNIEGSKGLCIV